MTPKQVASLIKDLEGQAEYYTDNEIQSLLGKDPTAGISEGEAEGLELKNQSRGSIGNLILRQYQAGTRVVSITENGIPSSLMDKWISERTDQKFSHIVRDRKIALGLWLIEKDDGGIARWKVLSPKNAIVLSVDKVNNEFGDLAGWRFKHLDEDGETRTYIKMYDSTTVYTFRQDGKTYTPVDNGVFHGASSVPMIPFYDLLLSDGSVKSLIEMISPALKNERQVSAQLAQLTWFNAVKQLFILNKDAEKPYEFDENGMLTPESRGRMANYSIRAGQGDRYVEVPKNQNPDQKTEIVQTAEGNLAQVVDVWNTARNRVISLASMPISVFDPTASTDSETWRMFDTAVSADQYAITPDLLSVFKITDEMEGVERETVPEIVYAPSNPAILQNQGDNVSKYFAAGVPIEWIARYVLRGFTPAQIQELLDMIASRQSQAGGGEVDFSAALGG